MFHIVSGNAAPKAFGKPSGQPSPIMTIDIDPCGIFDMRFTLDMCYALDMPCGAIGIYILSSCAATYRICF